ncbi:acyl-CoA dehydrogenase [Pseudomonas mosselii]|uniref:acyl-CoA dehydrogenase n=1 Tax=Pseudomonas mosselii TaxID=78327 RepID=UPI000BB50302|nr:acyl-CoA dehydrogenase [Pseudomonas mosselii]ATB64517.1 acyl-CoA dehydrogenase [Pseudomonas mosselii]MBC3449702.1 acyl-CoA dehydrogenase [Pseudomonas mosselii]MDH1099953.1 acyl-CoA dehydrogenase [Pseudomonas mosselii]MEB5935352.1 acyl-CoA dehydrogenase [Pseudomonas mosselii]UVN45354.1 acyl-CoA dehydrogenase [Pseudomonas mosselii]
MAWLQRLNDPLRHPLAATLGETYAAVLERLGAVAPFELAVLGGRAMATPGLAFLLGYQAALRVLWPSAPASLGALCATERRSVRPADMHTRLDGLRLSGSKDFVTAGLDAEWLLVAARHEGPGEAPRLQLAVVFPGEPGVSLEALPTLPLMPEVGHGRLLLKEAACELLAGDGWDAYVKPFRSLEDLYVLAALVAWLYGVAQECAWPQGLRLRLIGLLAGCAEGSRQCPDSVACHLLLGGLFAQFQGLRGEIDQALAAGPGHWAQLWQRDQGLLALAGVARDKRLAKAWSAAGLS